MFTCTKRYENIPFAHRQWRHSGHCSGIHGHNWTFEFTFAAQDDCRTHCGFVYDFGELKWLKQRIDQLDHCLLLQEDDPKLEEIKALGVAKVMIIVDGSCEGLAKTMHEWVSGHLRMVVKTTIWLVSVTVYEDQRNFATYTPPHMLASDAPPKYVPEYDRDAMH